MMTQSPKAGVRNLLLAVVTVILVAGCSTLPTSGEVRTEPGAPGGNAGPASYFVPPGPAAGADREAIVRGFLLAMQANPPSSSVARSFLTERARNTWKPNGTLVYRTASVSATPEAVVARFADAHRLDALGTWESGTAPQSRDLRLNFELEDGEWRITNPPSFLPVPTSYFAGAYLPYLLYFFDRTGEVLVPARVYLPRGEQVASSLVRGLLAGPTARAGRSTVTAFGSDVALDLAVVIKEGVAEVPLSARVQQLTRADLYRAGVQLAATLRQIPEISSIQVTVDGVAVPLSSGETSLDLDVAAELDPTVSDANELVTITGTRVLVEGPAGFSPVGGPFGTTGFALRAVAQSASGGVLAGIARNGTRAYLAPIAGDRSPKRVRTVLEGARNLLAPRFDRFGNLWLIDAGRNGAVVRVVVNGRARVVEVPGVSGQRVSSFTLTRDGAWIVAGLAGGPTPTLVVSALVRAGDGRITAALPASRVLIDQADLAKIVDLAQVSPTEVVVLTRSGANRNRLYSVEIDGSPGPVDGSAFPVIPGQAVAVLAGPSPMQPVVLVTADGQLLRPSTPAGEWVRSQEDVVDASYPQ